MIQQIYNGDFDRTKLQVYIVKIKVPLKVSLKVMVKVQVKVELDTEVIVLVYDFL